MGDGTGQSAASRELHISSHETINVSFVEETVVVYWDGSSVTSELCHIKGENESNPKCMHTSSMDQSPS